MSRQPTDRLLGRTITNIRMLTSTEVLADVHPGFEGAAVLELDDGSLIVASRMREPHGSSELLLVEPDGESWCTLEPVRKVTVPDVQAWRDSMQADGQAPATLNSRISAVSRFYKFMRELAAELRLPMVPPNPAHPVFIKRATVEAVQPTAALTRSLGHKLLSLPSASDEGMDEVLAARDRAILSCFLYVGLRTSSVCALDIADFHNDPSNPVLTITEKGRKATRRRVGVHVHGAQALKEYLEVSSLQAGPFLALLGSV